MIKPYKTHKTRTEDKRSHIYLGTSFRKKWINTGGAEIKAHRRFEWTVKDVWTNFKKCLKAIQK